MTDNRTTIIGLTTLTYSDGRVENFIPPLSVRGGE